MDITKTSTVLLNGLREPGNEQAWREVVARYQPMLVAFVRRCGFNETDTLDVVQECLTAFLMAFRDGKYDPEKGRLRSWLKGIALNKVCDARRKLAHRGIQVVDDSQQTAFLNRIPDQRDLTEIFEQEWERSVLAECLRRVRLVFEPQTLQAFELVALKGFTPEMVAAQLGVSRSVVYLSKSRVLSRLRQVQQEIADTW